MKANRKLCLLWLAVALWLGTLLFLSFQTGEGTAQTSGKLAMLVFKLGSAVGIRIRFEVLHEVLRLSAHIIVFLLFGALLEAAVTETILVADWQCLKHARGSDRVLNGLGLLTALLVCAFVAVMSEVIKVYIPGRHLDWPEVWLNVAGAWFGCGVMYTVRRIRFVRRKQ